MFILGKCQYLYENGILYNYNSIIFNIFTEARVLQVERKSLLKPDQAEFVLSEGMLIILIKDP